VDGLRKTNCKRRTPRGAYIVAVPSMSRKLKEAVPPTSEEQSFTFISVTSALPMTILQGKGRE